MGIISEMKRWREFKGSASRPLFWMLLGPLSLFLSMAAAPSSHSIFFPLVSFLGVTACWKWRTNGFSLTLLTLLILFLVDLYMKDSLLLLTWDLTQFMGVTIAFLAMEEVRFFYKRQWKGNEDAAAGMRLSLHTLEEKGASERRVLEREGDELQEELKRQGETIAALHQLVNASRIEAEKMQHQSDHLTEESLQHIREIGALEKEKEGTKKQADFMRVERQEMRRLLKKQLDALNFSRVEYFQSEIYNETYRLNLQKCRGVILSQRERLKQEVAPPTNDLKSLEQDKFMKKKQYDQILVEEKRLREKHKELVSLIAKISDDEERVHLALQEKELKAKYKERKGKLERTKAELIGIEREIFIIKKGMQQQGTPAFAAAAATQEG